MRPVNDNDPSRLQECELPEWLQRETAAHRQLEAEDRAKIGMAVLIVLLIGLTAMSLVYSSAGAA